MPRRHTATPTIGLALGGGAAQAFAQIPMLEALDDLGLKPARIAGTSMGAVIGAAYSAGMSGSEIRRYSINVFRNRSEFLSRLWKLRPRRVSEIQITIGHYDLERVLDAFLPDAIPKDFADLTIPLSAVATDYYAGAPAIFTEGALYPALAASAAVPMLFRPVMVGGRVMVDGGVCNPVPFDLVADEDILIAVDVAAEPSGGPPRLPRGFESLFGSVSLLMRALVQAQTEVRRVPDIMVRPPTAAFNILDFTKAAAIIGAAEPMKDDIKRQLDAAMRSLPARR